MLCTTDSTILHLSGLAPAPQPWRLDIVSALIGAALALLLIRLAYHFRHELCLGWEALVAPLAQLQHRVQASAEDRYRELVSTWARSLTVPAVVSLDAIFVEPRLISPAPPPHSLSEIESVLVGPQVLPLHRILSGHPQLVIMGTAGVGRTTLLAYVALVCARTVEGGNVEAEAMLEPVRERLPLYVMLSAMNWDTTDDESVQESVQENDEIEKLLSAAVAAVGSSSGMKRTLRQRLEAGQAIVLADGWDELSSQQRQHAAVWLIELVNTLPGNLWLVSTGTRGYAPLTEAGFVPLTLAAWEAGEVEEFARQWGKAWSPAGEVSPVPPRQLVAELRRAAQAGSSPLELALRAFVYLSDGHAPAKRAPLFYRALDLLLWQEEESWVLGACRATLGQVALDLQQEGRATASREEIEAAVESALPPSEERQARVATHIFRALTGERGLLRPAGPNRYVFAHPLWRAYLAARQLAAVDPVSLAERLDDPRWAEALCFYAELGDMKPLVAEWLRSPDDMFHTRLHILSSWTSVAPEGAAWRDGAMAILARGFLQSGHPAQVRQALAEALAATGVSGIAYFFKQALQHPDAQVRAAAVLGFARTAGESDLPALEAALEDDDPAVREAAVRGMAYLGADAATRWLAQMLLAGDETLSLAAAEALGQCGEEGVTFLRGAVESEDVMTRRAAVFGLARVGALDLLEKVAREDEQWIVRSAASAAVEESEKQEKISGIAPLPQIEQLPWLISWAATQGEGVGLGDAARQMLWRALGEGDAPVRLASALVLVHVGRLDDVEPLRTALTDPDPAVANAAFEALAEIGRRYESRIE